VASLAQRSLTRNALEAERASSDAAWRVTVRI